MTLWLALFVIGAPAATVSAQSNETRLWQDVSGRFQVRAQLLEHAGENVRLKTADGREISVPADRLSEADRQYLRSRAFPDDNPFGETETLPAAPAVPSAGPRFNASPSAGEQLALPDTGNTIAPGGSATAEFRADPVASAAAVPSVNVSLASVDAYDKISVPVLAAEDGSMVLAAIGRNMAGKPEEARGRIFAVNLREKRADLVWDKPDAVRIFDHDASSGQTLMVNKLDVLDRGGDLLVVEGLEAGSPQLLYVRTLPGAGQPGFAPQLQWARLLGAGHALVMVNDTVYLWDLPAAQLLYRIERVGSLTPPALSPGGRYLAIPTAGGATIIETASGEICGNVTMGSSLKPGAAFHDDGKQLLLCAGNQFMVWDCEAQTVNAEATTTEHLGMYPLHWVGPELFLSQAGALVHVELGMAIWKYSTAGASAPRVVGDKLLAATTTQQCSVLALDIPHPAAEAALGKLLDAGDAAMLVREGSEVAVSIESSVAGVDRGQIEQSLGEAIARAGWQVNPKAPITLVAKIGRGEPQQLNFRKMGEPLGRGGSTATLNPFTAELEIRRGSDVLWKRSSSNHIPTLLRLEEGETVQDAVNRYEKPNPEFFAILNLPPRIPKPEVTKEVGLSTLADGAWRDINPAAGPPVRPPRPVRRR